ncbi:Eukaryotic translation initiation factor 4 gamma 3 [Amphibalanus amphitrite]|uniref:Eukaryotic translation initiation factor 4 gamma 3 n=1 Tax=Amphibalanus amphitrite TaxID=1232801 RepID=A0A6A4VKY9_AMPAM|nr:Eukaryotic translation initiation factor 4 gamma 3 [Amphibalanus amphitrite]
MPCITQDMMSLVAVVPGNDRFPRWLFDDFFEELRGKCNPPEGERQLQHLEMLVHWLGSQPSLAAALEKVLQSINENERENLRSFVLSFSTSLDQVSFDFLRVAEFGVPLADKPPARDGVASPEPSAVQSGDASRGPSGAGLVQPPALLRAVARGAVPGSCISAVFGLPWRLWPAVEEPSLPCSSRAAVPLLARLAALLGAPVGPLVLFTRHQRQLQQLLASCWWRAPLLERVLLGGAESRRAAALAALRLRPGALAALPALLRLPAAALVEWRRVTAARSGRGQVRAVLLTLLAMTPAGTPPSALGLSGAAAAAWRARTAPLRAQAQRPSQFSLSAMHLYCELQGVYVAACVVNEVLERPLEQLDVEHTLHASLAMRLGFSSAHQGEKGSGEVQPGAELEELVRSVTDAIEDEATTDGDDTRAIVPAWKPTRGRSVVSEHPDLRSVRALTGILNKLTDASQARLTEKLRGLSAQTEDGLYALVDAVVRRVLVDPNESSKCANVCVILQDLEVKSAGARGGTVRFGDLLLTRLVLGVSPACLGLPRCDGGSWRRAPLGRADLLAHLATVPEREERLRQFRRLTAVWREAERRQRATLRLLAASIRRRLVPVWAARRCLERLLGGDGVTRPPAAGPAELGSLDLHTQWISPSPAERDDLRQLVDWCDAQNGPAPAQPPR